LVVLINEGLTTSTCIKTITVPVGEGEALPYDENSKPSEIWAAIRVAIDLELVK
jgi:hypothetical protein